VKTIGSCGKINANIKINIQKLVDICGYELARNLQNLTQRLDQSEKIPKSFRGAIFSETLCI